MKVRILGYHPDNETELTNDELPWAQVLLSPQCGSGKQIVVRSLRILVIMFWIFSRWR